VKNVMEKVNSMKGNINPYYDIGILDLKTLIEANRFDVLNCTCDGFRLGYLQGMKAAKAEAKKAAIAAA